jgi:hypothetical protein
MTSGQRSAIIVHSTRFRRTKTAARSLLKNDPEPIMFHAFLSKLFLLMAAKHPPETLRDRCRPAMGGRERVWAQRSL